MAPSVGGCGWMTLIDAGPVDTALIDSIIQAPLLRVRATRNGELSIAHKDMVYCRLTSPTELRSP
jgi:hypothetical protein